MKTFIIGLLLLVISPACAHNSNVTPQVRVAQFGTDVLRAVREAQESIIALNKNNPAVMTDAKTKQVLDGIMKITGPAEKLSDALKAYDAATTLDFRRLQAQEIYNLAAQVAALASAAFKVDLPDPMVKGVADIALNIINITRAIQIEMDKIRAPTGAIVSRQLSFA